MTFWEFLSEHMLGVIIIVGIICGTIGEVVKEVCDYKRDIRGVRRRKALFAKKKVEPDYNDDKVSFDDEFDDEDIEAIYI